MIDLRKIATLDLALQGPVVVRTEFFCGVFVSVGLGVFVLMKTQSPWQIALGIYLFCLAANYVPMLLWVMTLPSRAAAWSELGPEWRYRGRVLRKYRRQSLILLVPLFPLVLALASRNRDMRDQADQP